MTATKMTTSVKKEILKEAAKKLNEIFINLVDADCPSEAKTVLESLQDILDAIDYL